jgi:integrase
MAPFVKLYRIEHPKTPFQVTYIDATHNGPGGSPRRIRKHFSKLEDAEAYQQKITQQIQLVGVAGVHFDASARADYIAARTLLDSQGHGRTTLLELAREHVARAITTQAQTIADALDAFLEDQRRAGRSEPTIANLEVRIKRWMRSLTITKTDEIRKEHLDELLQRKRSPATIRNDVAAVSSFCTWLVHEDALDENPARKIRRPRNQRKTPHTWTAQQARAILQAAEKLPAETRNGLACLVLAGLRPSEIPEARIYLDKQPTIKVEGGKLKGRANRIVPIARNQFEWFSRTGETTQATALLPTRSERIRIVQRARALIYKTSPGAPTLKWLADTPRHTWISQRLTNTGDEKLTALEAGNSPDVIFRHYHKLMTTTEAKAFTRI